MKKGGEGRKGKGMERWEKRGGKRREGVEVFQGGSKNFKRWGFSKLKSFSEPFTTFLQKGGGIGKLTEGEVRGGKGLWGGFREVEVYGHHGFYYRSQA